MADFLVALADFDRRRGWESLGHASLFAFITSSSGSPRPRPTGASRRPACSSASPRSMQPLREGRLCLTTMAELAKVLTEENRDGGAAPLPRHLLARGQGDRRRAAAQAAAAPHAVVTTVTWRLVPRWSEPSRPALDRSPQGRPAVTGGSRRCTIPGRAAQQDALGAQNAGRPARPSPPSRAGRRRPAHRRAEPAQHHGQPALPAEAQDRPRRPLPRHPRRHHRAGARGGARPARSRSRPGRAGR